ncbi:response regulator transcription factor [Arenibacter sp. BSSL-BM3]|uniref:Response regulator transcription factor n=1 Tax=Arenibacter arenosicollis TaxID=2762274 RepID=A0ABR7QQ94_9FLAO|nr:LytTR family DNA-binding domain-containing protein [Arenibacter arenosicollis]MBC8769372.1 response regulator transcription factor [Arenibacter arenosicollis]
MKSIKAVIIEHENETVQLLNKFADENSMLITICGVENGFEAGMELIRQHRPELVFIHACDKNLKLFQLIKNIDFVAPKFIFMSNETSSAYQAFKLNALEFLLKPLHFNDIILSVYKVLKVCEMELSFQKIQLQEIDSINGSQSNKEFIAISSLDKIELVKTDDILYCKADGKYTEFILSNNVKILSTKNLGEHVNILNQNNFFRIHHSYLININHIVKINKKNGYSCEFSNGELLPVAKRRLDDFAKYIRL